MDCLNLYELKTEFLLKFLKLLIKALNSAKLRRLTGRRRRVFH